ncbi:MAG TPA: apolipoprotein N-acyltransferase [Opitutaceae bacterium]
MSAADPYAPLPPPVWEKFPRAVPAAAVGLTTALLTYFMFPQPGAADAGGVAGYAFAVPAIFWAYRRPSFKLFAWTMFAAQSVAWIAVLAWLRHVTWVGLFLLGPLVGAWVGIWYLAVWWAMPRILGQPHGIRILGQVGLAGLWVVCEWTRTRFITGFPWLPLAATQWRLPVILQIASVTGAYGVSFVLIVFNVGIGAYAHRLFFESATGFNRRSQEFWVALFALICCLCFFLHDGPMGGKREPLARVALIQPDIPQSEKWDAAEARRILQTLYQLSSVAGQVQPDFMLWPESALPVVIDLRGPSEGQQIVDSVVKHVGAPLLFGAVATDDTRWYDAAFVATPKNGLQSAYYAKRHLVPFGEYVPWHWLFGWVKKVVPIGEDCTPGPALPDPLRMPLRNSPATISLAPLVCYEDVFPDLARVSVRAGADALVVVTNDAWYGEENAAYQHAAHSVLRAVETRRPVIRDGNAGWSGWIDEFGNFSMGDEDRPRRTTVMAKDGNVYFRGTQTIPVMRDARWVGRQTFYVRYGDWFVFLSAALAVFGFWIVRTPVTVKKRPAADLL